jgi:predicted enzyme related to lactoylglutathione lyase
MTPTASHGHFVWHELLSSDLAASAAFYTAVVGSQTAPMPEVDFPYLLWLAEAGAMGGLIQHDGGRDGSSPRWQGTIAVADVDALCARAVELGGSVRQAPVDLTQVGRLALLADPQGHLLTLLSPHTPMQARDPMRLGEVMWAELVTAAPSDALHFYGDLFGWVQHDSYDAGPAGLYRLWGPDSQSLAGLVGAQPGEPAGWRYYLHVADLDASIRTAAALGGRLTAGPTSVPSGDRMAHLVDPQGVAFALYGKSRAR